MNYFKRLAVKTAEKIIGKTGKDAFWMPFGSVFQWNGSKRKIYEETAILEAVINKRAQCFGNAVVYVKDKQGNEPDNLQAKRIRSLFAEPNKLMSWTQFYRLIEVYRLLYGYCIVLKLSLDNEKSLPVSLFVIDPEQIDIKYDKTSPFFGQSRATDIYIAGQKTALKTEDLIIFNDIKFGFGNSPFLAQSRMTALDNENKLLAIISNAEHAIIRNRGALGILSKDINDASGAGMFDDKAEDLQEAYRKYGITSEQWNIIITSAALKWQAITPPLKDLMLTEFEEQTAKKICAVFDLPYELLPLSGQSTYANRREAETEFFQNYIIPCSKGDAELLTKSLCRGTDLTITFDYSDLWFLQEQMKEKAQAASIAITAFNSAIDKGNITREEWRMLVSEYINIDPTAKLIEQQTMLAVQLGVGGLEGLIQVVINPELTNEQKRAILIGVFDRTREQAFEIVPDVNIIVEGFES
ncbi:MAG: phage portal protein [Prevotellaceae bacterium]|jgi:hypothetical protein|nr:phage portal protein [Prevotellaceae bacterium]